MWRKKEETPTQKIEPQLPVIPKDNTAQEIELLKEKLRNIERNPGNTNVQPKKRTEVVKELPMQPVRSYRDDDGTIVELITIEEALSLVVNS